MLDFFRGRHSWRKLRSLLDRLPSHSQYRAAVAQDDEQAREFLNSGGTPKASPPPLTDMDYHSNPLLLIVLSMVAGALFGFASAKLAGALAKKA